MVEVIYFTQAQGSGRPDKMSGGDEHAHYSSKLQGSSIITCLPGFEGRLWDITSKVFIIAGTKRLKVASTRFYE